MFGDIELPEGVDPSFLAALPDNIRQEVIAEQLRLQRLQQRAAEQRQEAQSMGVPEVNPEFLAALPPNIQEEVGRSTLSNQFSQMQSVRCRSNVSPPLGGMYILLGHNSGRSNLQ